MSNGLNFFTNAIQKTPATGSWQDVDVSGDGVPSGASGVILEIRNVGANDYAFCSLRPNGSAWNPASFRLHINYWGGFAFCGLDANRVFEAYLDADQAEIWLIGYTGSDVVYLASPSSVTPGSTGSWIDVDVSGSIPSGAAGIACLILNPGATNFVKAGVRKNGGTDEFPYSVISIGYSGQIWQYCGLDVNRVFEAKVSSTDITLYVICYFKGVVTFLENGAQSDPATATAWTDKDVTAETTASANGVLLLAKNNTQYTDVAAANVRADGSTDNRITDHALDDGHGTAGEGPCIGMAIGLTAGQVFEYYVSSITDLDFYVIAYNDDGAVGVSIPVMMYHYATHISKKVKGG